VDKLIYFSGIKNNN